MAHRTKGELTLEKAAKNAAKKLIRKNTTWDKTLPGEVDEDPFARFNTHKPRIADIVGTITIRAHADNRGDFNAILRWARLNNTSFSAIINAYLPAINYAIHNCVFAEKHHRYIRSDFGDVRLRNPL